MLPHAETAETVAMATRMRENIVRVSLCIRTPSGAYDALPTGMVYKKLGSHLLSFRPDTS